MLANILDIVLVLAGVELISFTVSSMGLCFGFALNTGLITERCFVVAEQGLHRAKAFSAFHTAMLVMRLGVQGRLGGDTGRTGNPN